MKVSPTITNCFLPPKVLKLCPDIFETFPHPLFCPTSLTRFYPDIWKSAKIRPKFLNGAKNFIFNHRLFSPLPKGSLLFEKIVYMNIFSYVWMKIHPKLPVKIHSVLQLVHYLEHTHRMKILVTYNVYLDFEKAFDKVPRTVLSSELGLVSLDWMKNSMNYFNLSGRSYSER